MEVFESHLLLSLIQLMHAADFDTLRRIYQLNSQMKSNHEY